MNLHRMELAMLAVGAALVIAGVRIEGTEHNPTNLFMCYLLSVVVIKGLRQRPTLWAWISCTVVAGSAIYGAAWTLGPKHAASAWAMLVYIGLVGAVLSSLMMPLRSGHGQDKRSA